jgi:hypothetical protein
MPAVGGVTDRRRYVALEPPGTQQRKMLERLKERYVRGEVTLPEYEAALEQLLDAPHHPDPAVGHLRLKAQPSAGLRVVVGAGAGLLLAAGLLFARGLRLPHEALRRSVRGHRRTEPASLLVDVLVVWQTDTVAGLRAGR